MDYDGTLSLWKKDSKPGQWGLGQTDLSLALCGSICVYRLLLEWPFRHMGR